MILERGSKGARNATAVLDSNGFGGIAICSHKDRFEEETGTLMALDYRSVAKQFYNKSGVKVMVARNQEFPGKVIRQKILEYLNKATENIGIIDA